MNHLVLVVGVFLFTLYWFALSIVVGHILEKPRLKNIYWLFIGLINGCLIWTAVAFSHNLFFACFLIAILALASFVFFYKDKFSSALLCALGCAIHIIAFFIIVISSFSMITGLPPHEILSQGSSIALISTISFFFLDLAMIIIIKFLPLTKVKVINQHKEQQWFMSAWMAVNNVFLIYIATAFYSTQYSPHLAGNQISASVTTMLGLYIVLFFSIKTCTMLGYKEQNLILEQAIHQEQQYRISMAKDAVASYEINVTTNQIITGFEEHREKLGAMAYSYNDILNFMVYKLVHTEDMADFTKNFSSENMLRIFESGKTETSFEYRRLLDTGTYIWVKAFINFVQNGEDVKAFVFIKNIDEKKKQQLELQRKAERDPLTGLYNKSTTAKLVDEHITFNPKLTSSALFMIDVDNFKSINDHLGHVFGDAVLCELADKLTKIFRASDIVGRIGGDEYIVFARDGITIQQAEGKAEEVCRAFHITYNGMDNEHYTISSSVGISFFPKDATTFTELYNYADVALYAAKSNGKNDYQIYDGGSFEGYSSPRTEIQAINDVSQKSFKHNRIEYVFKMLYQSENPVAAIHSVLELLARHYSFERGYIFETSKNGKTTSNTFEWCADGVIPEMSILQDIPIEAIATANSYFKKTGTFILHNLDELPTLERSRLEPQNIKSMFQFGVFDKSRLLGFIGFDNCKDELGLNNNDLDSLKTICNMLSTFFVKEYIDQVSAKDLRARQEVMNNLDTYIYVINMQTFEVLFMNDKIQKLVSETVGELTCYNFFRGNKEQCYDCPIRKFDEDDASRIISEIYNDKLEIWMEVAASPIRWADGTLACLINCTDITAKKETQIQHIQELETMLYVDEMTDCFTYQKFKAEIQHILEKHHETAYYLAKLDIDNFKLINQIYGYNKGNEVLCSVADALGKTIRSENDIIARISNDEFVGMFAIQDPSEVESINEAFNLHFSNSICNDFEFKINFTYGRYIIDKVSRARFDTTKLDVNDILEKVNIAHKTAKLNKTKNFAYYNEDMTSDALRIKEIEDKMESALKNNEFTVYLQPKYCLDSGRIGGAEALTRWENTNKNLFYPGAFIPAMERNGFITSLDLYVFEKVCLLIKGWLVLGLNPVVVSINFSKLHLNNTDFVKKLCEISDKFGVPHKYLEIEITETVIYDNMDALISLLDDLHRHGFTMSMDDFGVGYSSLGMLNSLPVDTIKMDRSFFSNGGDLQRSKAIVGSIIQMASGLDMGIVAEGVEDQKHIDILKELQCDMVQGYYYAKPMPIEEFEQLLFN